MAKKKPIESRSVWDKALEGAADPERVRRALVQWDEAGAREFLDKAGDEHARILAALISGSQATAELLVVHPEWLPLLGPEQLEHPRQEQGLRAEVAPWLEEAWETLNYTGVMSRVRQFRQLDMCRIAARDLARLGDVVQITRELSNLADVCLEALYQVCWHQMTRRFGVPHHQDSQGHWRLTGFAVLGLGKLGGQELNYSSDVDLMFLYDEEGAVFKEPPHRGQTTPPDRAMTNHEFFKRLAESLVQEATRATADGCLFRVDLRLRPEGDAGPLVRSLNSCENYYAQWGQIWERMMLIKARRVAGDAAVAGEFLEMIQPFRYPRSLSDRALREMAAMKERTETEIVRSGEIDRNVKLGRGGIREIEFIAQTAQILNAGRTPFLQGAQTLPTLKKLVQYQLLSQQDAACLSRAYCFLRDVEHRVQMDQNRQTHTIPAGPEARERLARLMGFRNAGEFEAARRNHAGNVRRIYERQIQSQAAPSGAKLPRQFEAGEEEWKEILARHGFRDTAQGLKLLKEFVQGPGYTHVSPRTCDLSWELVPKMLALCPGGGDDNRAGASEARQDSSKAKKKAAGNKSRQAPVYDAHSKVLSDPDRVLARLDRYLSAYGARSGLIETWTHNPAYFELLLLLFDRSEFLAETAIRTPDLVDDQVQSGRLNRRRTAEETLEDLRYGLRDEDQHVWLRRYHQAELMRIGLKDILELSDFEENLAELTNLADACLQYALEVVLRKHRLKKPPFVIAGLGKLGGREINFGSDLDIVFVADVPPGKLPSLQSLAVEVMDLLSRRTEHGMLFETDARLRPDGEKGLMVNTLDAFEDYYRRRAQLWEIQALSRTRPLAGDMKLGEALQNLVAALTNFVPRHVEAEFPCRRRTTARANSKRKEAGGGKQIARRGLAAYAPDWKTKIAEMRARIEKERTPAGREALAIKTGRGGLIDAEFIAQAMCLEHGWQEGNTLRGLERIRDEKILAGESAEALIRNYRELRRVEGILRRWSLEGETELPRDPAAFRRVSIRCGFSSEQDFQSALEFWREGLRRVYGEVFAG